MSLAEAEISPGSTTKNHLHKRSAEIYYILHGRGIIHLDGEESIVAANDAIYIPPGTEHFIENTGKDDLVIICCSTPPYSDNDTEIL
jgi:mannose-6-phosphate isomerase-like protein (cupin superfamily)